MSRRFKNIRRRFSVLVIVLLMSYHMFPYYAYAEEPQEVTSSAEVQQPSPTETPSPTPTEGSDADITNQADVETDVLSEADTGNNEISQITPSPSPTPVEDALETLEEVSALQDESETAELEETLESTLEEVLGTGEEDQSPDEQDSDPLPPPGSGSSEIETGNAVSETIVETDVNTTEVASSVIFQTINIFIPGDVNLAINPFEIARRVVEEDNNTEEMVTVSIVDVDNYAYVSNEIFTAADTGNNLIEGGRSAIIDTGDAYAVVALLNKVNTTIIGSTIHLITVNVFGNVEGNIILPEFSDLIGSGSGCCAPDSQVENEAQLINDVESAANSGGNTIQSYNASGSSITTGDATSVVNITNMVNTTLIGVMFHQLFINVLGGWEGEFLGWDDIVAMLGGQSLAISSTTPLQSITDGCPECSYDQAGISNQAYVENNVISLANSGGNEIEGARGDITTGNAYSSVSIFNLINSTIINSFGFLGYINIFGYLKGDIGGESQFIEETSQPEQSQGEPWDLGRREAGGVLEVTQYNNVNDFVYPGDVVTFFINVKNVGVGKVYDTKLVLSLIDERGFDVGGGIFELGEIHAHTGYKITTGLKLSEVAPGGAYIARALVFGKVGPDNSEITASADSYFNIKGKLFSSHLPGVVEDAKAAEEVVVPEVLGSSYPQDSNKDELKKRLIYLLLLLLSIYLPSKSYQNRKELIKAFSGFKGFFGL